MANTLLLHDPSPAKSGGIRGRAGGNQRPNPLRRHHRYQSDVLSSITQALKAMQKATPGEDLYSVIVTAAQVPAVKRSIKGRNYRICLIKTGMSGPIKADNDSAVGHSLADAAAKGAEAKKVEAFDAETAGMRVVEQYKQAEDGAWTGRDLQKRFNLSSATLHKRRREYRILFWRDARNDFHYPKWQFNEAGALLPGVQAVLQTFRSRDEWRLMRYFLGVRQQLDGRRPLDLLRVGKVAQVTAHAKSHAEEDTW